ncbi:hypothetical protein [Actinomadura litoris]|uniref:hypothetical protein n=1 Tax=Actinomadura litoris TaxID=2678616 RepID=UPI001FA6F0E5|nr:hypothetical protein [Actinomadura litoris]
MQHLISDPRREVEVLAYQVRSFPALSPAADLADLGPGLSDAEKDAALGDLIDGITLRDAACEACKAGPERVAAVLADRVDTRLAARVTGLAYLTLLLAAKARAAIAAAGDAAKDDRWDGDPWDALDGLDQDIDGALVELSNIQVGYATAVDYPDVDPDDLERQAKDKILAALGDFSARTQARLESALVDFTVAVWRHADGARLRLTGGAR